MNSTRPNGSCKIVPVVWSLADSEAENELVLGLVPRNMSTQQAVEVVCHERIAAYLAEGYVPARVSWQEHGTLTRAPIIRLVLCKPVLAPEHHNDKGAPPYAVSNGLIGMNRDLLCKSLFLLDSEEALRRLVGCAQVIYGWSKTRVFTHFIREREKKCRPLNELFEPCHDLVLVCSELLREQKDVTPAVDRLIRRLSTAQRLAYSLLFGSAAAWKILPKSANQQGPEAIPAMIEQTKEIYKQCIRCLKQRPKKAGQLDVHDASLAEIENAVEAALDRGRNYLPCCFASDTLEPCAHLYRYVVQESLLYLCALQRQLAAAQGLAE